MVTVIRDYIYANGQKIARVASQSSRMHIEGNSDNGAGEGFRIGAPANYTIGAGDKLFLRQFASPTARAGVVVSTASTCTCWLDVDQHGEYANAATTTGQWASRTIDLSRLAGQPITAMYVVADTGSTGNWSVEYADMAILSLDGTVTPLFNGQPTSITPAYGAAVDLSASFATDASFGPATHYYLADHLGTTQMELSAGGWPVWQGYFSPYGKELLQADAIGNQSADGTSMRYKFTGKERDTESGLDYFGARYYGSSMGRFMSPDPSGLMYADPTNPQSLNLYSYALNNPLRLFDPTGLTPCDYGSSDQGGEDYEDADNDKECTDNGGHPIDASETVNVNANNSGDDSLSTVSNGSSTLVQYQTFDGAPNNQNRDCFLKGAATSVVTGLIVDGAAIGARELGVPPPVTGPALFVLGVAGGVSLGIDIVQNIRSGNTAGLYYDAGSVTAGLLTGGLLGGKVAKSIDTGATSGWSVAKDVNNRFRPSLGFKPGPWLAPDQAAARGATGAASGLGSLFTGCGK